MLLVLATVVFGFMAIEARRAARNERLQRAHGGIEPPSDVYAVMQADYPGAFVAMLVEAAFRATTPHPRTLIVGVFVFLLAKALKWWAILTLGPFWTFRVIVVPGATLVASGPYRLLRHPNYVAVVGELVGVGLITGAFVAGPLATAAFGALILKRVAVEERALGRGPQMGRNV